jgi:hypothetical protein
MAKSAIAYIDSEPIPLANRDLNLLGKNTASVISSGKWTGNDKPRINKMRDKARIDMNFLSGRNLVINTATLHKKDGLWQLQGVAETMRAFSPSF